MAENEPAGSGRHDTAAKLAPGSGIHLDDAAVLNLEKAGFEKKKAALKAEDDAEKKLHNGPYVRLLQPDTPNADLKDGSYLRLGSYIQADAAMAEENLVTHLSTTFGYVEDTVVGAEDNAEHAEQNADREPGKQFIWTTQATDQIRVAESATRSSENNGILLYTSHDLQENIVGSALMKYGKGHTVEVSDFDASYDVKQGEYSLSAKNGVLIKAGIHGDGDHDRHPANIELISEGYIKQKSFGNLDERTFGDSHKVTHGVSTELLLGKKVSRIHGADISMKMAAVLSLVLGVETNLRVGLKISLILAGEFSLIMTGTTNIILGKKMDFIANSDLKIIAGSSRKFVIGDDFKMTRTDTKVVAGNDIKFVGLSDAKRVDVSGAIIDTLKWEEVPASMDRTKIADYKKELSNHVYGATASDNKGPLIEKIVLKIYQ